MSKPKRKGSAAKPGELFDRIVGILEQARRNVVRAVDTNMVTAYWLIGREIVEEIQHGRGRAKYGEKVLEDLSTRLSVKYGQGFSVPNLKNFRQFYQAYPDRHVSIGYPMGSESADKLAGQEKARPSGVVSSKTVIHRPTGSELVQYKKSYPSGSDFPHRFSPQLSWSHYRALMRVENREARNFYERETIAGGWDNLIHLPTE